MEMLKKFSHRINILIIFNVFSPKPLTISHGMEDVDDDSDKDKDIKDEDKEKDFEKSETRTTRAYLKKIKKKV